jgi:geranylgeranyl pyrophosphate synthase
MFGAMPGSGGVMVATMRADIDQLLDSVDELLDTNSAAVNARIARLLAAETDRSMAPMLIEQIRYQMASGGKLIRPTLCLLACEAQGGRREDALEFATAVEILHNFLLVADDLMDGDEVRRDDPTLWKRYGAANAVNVAIYMQALGQLTILGAPLPPETLVALERLFAKVLMRTGEGQALDVNLKPSRTFTLDRYLEIARLKSGYIGIGLLGGALIAGAVQSVLDALDELSGLWGALYQIRDDIIDLTEGKGRGGEIGCDIKEGKPSILVAICMEHASDPDAGKLLAILAKSRADTTADDVGEAIRLFHRYGAIGRAEATCLELVARSGAIIERLPYSAVYRDRFRDLGQYLACRRA